MSFSNFNSSASGPLLVAFLLALFVLGGFVVLGTLSLDPRYWGGEKLESVIASNAKKIEDLQAQQANLSKRAQSYDALRKKESELDEMHAILQQQRNQNANLAMSLVGAKEEVFNTEQSHFDYIQNYRAKVRSEAEGKKMDMLTTIEGETYKDVTITKVEAIGMGIQHESGGRRIPYKELPLEMQDYYQFGENEAKELLQRENERRIQNSLAEEAAIKSAAERQAMLDSTKNAQKEAARRSALSKAQSDLISLDGKISRVRSDISAQSSQKISQAPQLRNELQNLEDLKRKLEAQIRQLSTVP
ncbi:MAG: hypothetical protein V4727_10005 [Verrucomicrobiota bacterium]